MILQDLLDYGMRYLGALMALGALAGWIFSATHQWEQFDPRSQRLSIGVGAVLLAIAYGLIEAAQQEVPFGTRVAIMCVALALLIGALALPNRRLR